MAIQPFSWPEIDRLAALTVKAQREGVTFRRIPRFQTVVLSASVSVQSVSYFTDELACSCPAGQYGHLCKHRALYMVENFERLVLEYGLPHWHTADSEAA